MSAVATGGVALLHIYLPADAVDNISPIPNAQNSGGHDKQCSTIGILIFSYSTVGYCTVYTYMKKEKNELSHTQLCLIHSPAGPFGWTRTRTEPT